MFSKVHPLFFLISFAVGLFFCYISQPKPQIIMKFPSPYNAGKITYRDDDNNCYKYKAEKVECPLDRSLVKPQPVVEN